MKTTKNKKIAIFFDFDGVLLDNTEYSLNKFEKFFKEFLNTELDEKTKEFLLTHKIDEIVLMIKEKYKIKEDPKEIKEKLVNTLLGRFFDEFLEEYKKNENFKKLKNLIKNLKKDYYLAIISHSLCFYIEKTIEVLEIKEFFDEVICSEKLKDFGNKKRYLESVSNKFEKIYFIEDSIENLIGIKQKNIVKIWLINIFRNKGNLGNLIEKTEDEIIIIKNLNYFIEKFLLK